MLLTGKCKYAWVRDNDNKDSRMWSWGDSSDSKRGNAQRMEWVYFQVGSTTNLKMKGIGEKFYLNSYGIDSENKNAQNLARWTATDSNDNSGIKMSYGDVRTLMNNLYGIKSVSWLETNRGKDTRPYKQADTYLTNSHTYSLFESLSGAVNGLFETYGVDNADNLTIFEYVDLCENVACLKISTQYENACYIEFTNKKSSTDSTIYANSYTGSIYTVLNQFEIVKFPYGARYSFNGFTPVAIPAEYTGAFVYSHVNLAKLTCYMGFSSVSSIVGGVAQNYDISGRGGENNNLVAYRYW